MKRSPHGSPWWRPISSLQRAARDFELYELDELVSESHKAPNISLNGGSIHTNEVRLVAFTALALQLGVVVFFIFSVYNFDLSQDISQELVPDSALPVTVAGTLALMTGTFICTCVVEARTRLTRWVRKMTLIRYASCGCRGPRVLATNPFSPVQSLLIQVGMRLFLWSTMVKETLRFGLVLAQLLRLLVSWHIKNTTYFKG